MGLVLVTAPESEPLARVEVIQHLRLPDDTDEGDLLDGLVATARDVMESKTNRALMTQTWRLVLDRFPGSNCEIQVPKPPLQNVTSITYVDMAGVTQTLPTAQYQVDTASLMGRIVPAYGCFWPITRCQPNAVTVEFVAGYGDAAAVPAGIKSAMKLLVGSLYENRESIVSDVRIAAIELPLTVDALLSPYRVLVPG